MVVDLAVATLVAAAPLVFKAVDLGDIDGVDPALGVVDVVCSAAAFALIMARRLAPIPVLAVALAVSVWSLGATDDQAVFRAATCVVLYTVASTSSRRVAWTAGFICAAALFVTMTATRSTPWYDGDNLEVIAWTAVATAAGDAVRSRRAYVEAREDRATALRERAERAEQALQEEARRQVVEERLRIARELHDVVAHHIAVINVQAGVASHLLRDDPIGAEAALGQVRHGASAVLDEFAGILSVLRRPDDAADTTDPLPTLDRLDELLSSFDAAGLEVVWTTSGVRRALEPTVALTAYRIVQEALTNAHKHGAGAHASLRVDYRPDALDLEVFNDTASSTTSDRQGHGIAGMRERVAAVGGTIDIGRAADGRFRVRAELPTATGAPQ